MYKYFLFFALGLVTSIAFCQNTTFSMEVGMQVGAGIAFPNRVDAMGSNYVMRPQFKLMYLGNTVDANGRASTQFLFPRNYGLMTGFRLGSWGLRLAASGHQMNYHFIYPDEVQNPNTLGGGWVKDIRNYSYSAGLYKSFGKYFGQFSVLYGTGYKSDGEKMRVQDQRVDDYTQSGYGTIVTYHYREGTQLYLLPEFGIKGMMQNTVPYEWSVSAQIPLSSNFKEDFQLVSNGTIIGTNSVTYKPAGIFVNYRVPFAFTFEKKEKANSPKRIEPKRTKVDHELIVRNQKVKVRVFDNNASDGDMISVYINGELVLEEYVVDKAGHTLEVNLQEGDNYIAIYALNEGRIPPNTASLSVDDGKFKQTVNLRTAKRRHTGIKLNYQPL